MEGSCDNSTFRDGFPYDRSGPGRIYSDPSPQGVRTEAEGQGRAGLPVRPLLCVRHTGVRGADTSPVGEVGLLIP